MHLSLLDFMVIAAYLLGLSLVGFYFSKRQTSEVAYFLGNRRLPWPIVGLSLMASLISTLTYLSFPGEMIAHGTGYFYSVIGIILVIPLVTRVIIPALRQLPVTTVYEYFGRRYGPVTRSVSSLVFIFSRLLWVSLIIYTTSFAVHEMTAWDIRVIVLVIGIVTTVYTTAGGMAAVVWTDCVQAVLLLAGAAFVPMYIALLTNSNPSVWWSAFSQVGRVEAPVFSWDITVRITIVGIILSDFVWNACTQGADQVAVQRYLSTASVESARRSVWVFSVTVVALILLLGLVGLALFYFEYQQAGGPLATFADEVAARADSAFPRFIAEQLPRGVSGLLLAAILSAAMSSLSSAINSICTVIITDFVHRNRKQATGEQNMKLVKITAFSVGVLGIASALAVTAIMQSESVRWNLVEMIGRISNLFVAPLGVLFLAGVLLRRVSAPAALSGFVAGSLCSILVAFRQQIFQSEDNISFTWVMPLSFVVSVLVTFLASFVFAPPSAIR
jgi:SSS family transporter